MQPVKVPSSRVDEVREQDIIQLKRSKHVSRIGIDHRISQRHHLVGSQRVTKRVAVSHKLLLMEIRQRVDRIVADHRQQIKIVLVGDLGQFLGHIDAPDVVRDEVRHIVAHLVVLHDGDHAGDEQGHGYRTEAQRKLHPHREPELLHSVRKFPEHFPKNV